MLRHKQPFFFVVAILSASIFHVTAFYSLHAAQRSDQNHAAHLHDYQDEQDFSAVSEEKYPEEQQQPHQNQPQRVRIFEERHPDAQPQVHQNQPQPLRSYNEQDYLRARNGEKNLANAHLEGADLSNLDLRGVDFSGADLTGANLDDSDLSGAMFNGGSLVNAHIINQAQRSYDNVQIIRTNCSGIALANVRFSDHSFINEARFSHAWFHNVRFVDSEIRNTTMTFLNAENLEFIAMTLNVINFSYAHILYLVIDKSKHIGEGLDFSYATIFRGRIKGEDQEQYEKNKQWANWIRWGGTGLGACMLAGSAYILWSAEAPSRPTSSVPPGQELIGKLNEMNTGLYEINGTSNANGFFWSLLENNRAIRVAREHPYAVALGAAGGAVMYYANRYYCCLPMVQGELHHANFNCTRLEEVSFSDIKLTECRNVNHLRDASGVSFQNASSNDNATIQLFESSGAKEEGKQCKDAFKFYWTNADRQQVATRATMSLPSENSSTEQTHQQVHNTQEININGPPAYNQDAFERLKN
ncbi:MAG: pentapeptide repeat-containing protein, partial [Candidatus Babeliales bacterium]